MSPMSTGHYRVTYRDEKPPLPSDVLYDVVQERVVRWVEVDRNGDIFWNDISCYDDPMDMHEGLHRDSLLNYPFNYEEGLKTEQTLADGNSFWQKISKSEFESWYKRAQETGRRRYEVGEGTYLIE